MINKFFIIPLSAGCLWAFIVIQFFLIFPIPSFSLSSLLPPIFIHLPMLWFRCLPFPPNKVFRYDILCPQTNIEMSGGIFPKVSSYSPICSSTILQTQLLIVPQLLCFPYLPFFSLRLLFLFLLQHLAMLTPYFY